MSQLSEPKQRTILFLIADTGAGHRSAANAISNAIRLISQQEQEEWEARAQKEAVVAGNASDTHGSSYSKDGSQPLEYRIKIVDVFEEYSRFPLREVVKLYGPTIRYNPKLFGEFFNFSNREGSVMTMSSLASPLILNGLLRLFTTIQPDVVVSIHPIINFVTIRALRQLSLPIPFITVVTDLVSVHYSWFAPGADAYIVPTEQAKQLYLKRKLDPKRVHMLGMPIDPKYTHEVKPKEALQRTFGLSPDLPTVLLVGGGDGAGGLHTAIRAISQAHLPVQLMVVTGRNKKLYALLQRTRSRLHVPAHIFGFVNNMPELMHAADVLITKAGPGTICEALACGLPLILSGYVPGQEEGNVDYVVHNDVGVLAMDARTLTDALRRLLKPGSPELQRRLQNAARISRPASSFDIGRKILSFLPAADQPGVWQSQHSHMVQEQMSGRLHSAIRIRRLRSHLTSPISISKNTVMRRFSKTQDISSEQPGAVTKASRRHKRNWM
ncbi:MGDG synthase family glycosyltransferase [Dictyobacter arantiisoli]|uniref:Galactosyldiacylglycerol synthase n=1 Tax=Dictyobacter arantiisoli TaxID=2014874 RepID=A0A5A5TFC2_9CHLR|nr:glycosyltransferase [Dictyobacter arantiisoli]GCF10271.1 galactosyldiacylglycerol synthase [Dictyobacter arantiisoli]